MLTIVDHDDDSNEPFQAVGAGRSLLDEIVHEGARQMLAAALQAPGPLVTSVLKRTVAKFDSTGLVVRRCTQRSAGYRKNSSSTSGSSVIFATAFGYFAP